MNYFVLNVELLMLFAGSPLSLHFQSQEKLLLSYCIFLTFLYIIKEPARLNYSIQFSRRAQCVYLEWRHFFQIILSLLII